MNGNTINLNFTVAGNGGWYLPQHEGTLSVHVMACHIQPTNINIEGKQVVINRLVLYLMKNNAIDVHRYEDLLGPENVGRKFTVKGVKLKYLKELNNPNTRIGRKLELNLREGELVLKRKAFYNIMPEELANAESIPDELRMKKGETWLSFWEKHSSDEKLDKLFANDNGFNLVVDRYNLELENDNNYWLRTSKYYYSIFNSGGKGYEVRENNPELKGLLDRTDEWGNNILEKTLTRGVGIEEEDASIHITPEQRKRNFKFIFRKAITTLKNKKQLVQDIEKWLIKNNHEDLLRNLPVEEFFDTGEEDNDEENTQHQGDGDQGIDKKTCPQCGKKYDTDTISYNEKNYCSENCKNEANKGDNKKYTCSKCNKEFSTSPTVKDGKSYCSDCGTKSERPDQKGPGKDQNKNLSQTRIRAIQAINEALHWDPKLSSSELDSNYRNWEDQIKGFNKEEDINNLKDQVLSNINKKRAEKKSSEEIKNEIDKLQDLAGELLRNKVKEIQKSDGKKGYENQREKISQQEDRVFQEDPETFKNMMKEIVENKMSDCKVSEGELGSEEKELYTKIKNKQIGDKDQLKESKNKLVKYIGNKEAEKEITALKKEVKAAIKSGKKEQIKKVKDKLLLLSSLDNVYLEKYKTEIKNFFKSLENISSDTTDNSPSDIPWRIIVPVVVIAGLIIGLVLIIKRRKNYQDK